MLECGSHGVLCYRCTYSPSITGFITLQKSRDKLLNLKLLFSICDGNIVFRCALLPAYLHIVHVVAELFIFRTQPLCCMVKWSESPFSACVQHSLCCIPWSLIILASLCHLHHNLILTTLLISLFLDDLIVEA